MHTLQGWIETVFTLSESVWKPGLIRESSVGRALEQEVCFVASLGSAQQASSFRKWGSVVTRFDL